LDAQTSALFSLEYTIPRTQAGKKAVAQGKLVIKEKLPVSGSLSRIYDISANCRHSPRWLIPHQKLTLMMRMKTTSRGRRKSKRRYYFYAFRVFFHICHFILTDYLYVNLKHIPTEEEINQDAIIKRLTELHMCEDRKCTFQGPCWVDAEGTAHIHLTHLHLRTWAAAIVRP
jgi:hypothetical protein